MTCIERYTFSRRFTALAGPVREDAEAAAPQPAYSDLDLARARSEGHAAGHGEGYAAGLDEGRSEAAARALAAREQRELEVLAQLSQRLEQAVGERDAIAADAERAALALALAALRKSLPALHRRHGPGEIEAMIADLPVSPAEPATVQVFVHPDFVDALGDRLDAVAASRGLDNRLKVAGDPTLAAGDGRIAWNGGGVERRLAALMARIHDIVETVAGDPPGDGEAASLRSIERHG